jgi:hypothetical protein
MMGWAKGPCLVLSCRESPSSMSPCHGSWMTSCWFVHAQSLPQQQQTATASSESLLDMTREGIMGRPPPLSPVRCSAAACSTIHPPPLDGLLCCCSCCVLSFSEYAGGGYARPGMGEPKIYSTVLTADVEEGRMSIHPSIDINPRRPVSTRRLPCWGGFYSQGFMTCGVRVSWAFPLNGE